MISIPRWWWWRKQRNSHTNFSTNNGTFSSLKRQLQGSKSCNIGGNPETTKTAESDECVDVWMYSPYVAAEVSASGTRLATNWQLFQITNFNVEDQRDSSSNQVKQVWLKSHILSSVALKFWSEGPGSPLKLKLLDLYLRPPFFKSCYILPATDEHVQKPTLDNDIWTRIHIKRLI